MQTKISTEAQADLARAQEDLKSLHAAMPKVAVRAMNKAMTGAKTDTKKIIRMNYNFKSAALEKRMKISRASRHNMKGKVTSQGRMIHLTDIAGTRQTKKGVTVNVKKSTGRQLIPRAFIASGRNSQKRIVFRREAKADGSLVGRYPIGARMAPFPEDIYNTPENWAKIQKAAAKRIDKNLEHEIDREFKKY